MSKNDCKSPNVWVHGTIDPYTKGYCTTVKEILNIEKKECNEPNIWVPGTKQPYKKGHCAVPNLKTPSPVKQKTPSPVKQKTPESAKNMKIVKNFVGILEPQIKFMKQFGVPYLKHILIDEADKSKMEKVITGELHSDKLILYISEIDSLFKHVPPLTHSIEVNVQDDNFNFYNTTTMLKTDKTKYKITIPKGAHILPYLGYYDPSGLLDIILPRQTVIKNKELSLPQNLPFLEVELLKQKQKQKTPSPVKPKSSSPVKPKTPSPVKQKTPSPSKQKSIMDKQIDAVDKLTNAQKEVMKLVFSDWTNQSHLDEVDNIFEMIPKTTVEIKGSMGIPLDFQKAISIKDYAKIFLKKITNNNGIVVDVIIPPGAHIVPISETFLRLPRNSTFTYKNGVYTYKLPTTKQKTSPVKQKAPTTTQTQTVEPHKQYHPESAIYVNKKHAVMLKEQIDYMKTLDKDTVQALKYYTGNGYEDMNSQLNKGKLTGKIKNYVILIDEAFKNAPPTKDSFVLYRGIKLHKKIETDFTSKTYVSTSSDKNTSLGFNAHKSYKCCFFEITVPKGARLLPLMYLSLHSQEMEILLSRDSYYKIVKHSFTPKGNTIIAKYVEKIDEIQPVGEAKKNVPSTQQQVQSKCKPEPKYNYNPEKYVCNEATSKWVLKTGDIGKKILTNKPKTPSPVKQKTPSPVKPKTPAKQKTPSPVKQKSPSSPKSPQKLPFSKSPFSPPSPPPKVQSKCKPNPKYSPVKYICNEATGKWVLKTGDIGIKILANKLKSPKPKSKSAAKKVVYTKEQMYDKFKETFKDDLLGFIGKDKPKFRVATSGGYGVKMTLEEKHGIFGKIITKDIDLTVSVYNSTMDGTECYHYLYNKVMKFIKESGDAKNFKVEVLKMYNSFVPIFKYTRYYIIMIEYKKDEFIDLAITNMNMSDKMIDIPLSKKVGLPIKTEEEYLREFLIFVYMENVPGVNDQVYYKRNPVVGKLPAKGQKDILNSKLLCDKVKKKNYEGYCKLLKDITVEKLKAMPKYERDDYFKSLKMITGQ